MLRPAQSHRALVVTDRFEGRRNRHWLGEVEVDRGRTTDASFAISNTTVVLLDGQRQAIEDFLALDLDMQIFYFQKCHRLNPRFLPN